MFSPGSKNRGRRCCRPRASPPVLRTGAKRRSLFLLLPPRRLDALQWQRRRFLGVHIDDADAVVIRVGDVELVPGEAQAARLVEHLGLEPTGRVAQKRLAFTVAGI